MKIGEVKNKRLGMAALAALVVAAIVYAGPAGGTISGKVTYEGTPAKMKTIDMSKEPSCAKQHATPVTTEGVVTGPNNSLENVVVYISAGIPDDSAPSTPVKFDQKGCQYIPHVLAFQVNQPLEIINDDQTSHNIHPRPMINREWNKSQPPGSPPDTEKIRQAGIHSSEVQYSSLDVRPICSHEKFPLRCFQRRRRFHASKFAAGKIHSHRVARILRRPVAGDYHRGVGD